MKLGLPASDDRFCLDFTPPSSEAGLVVVAETPRPTIRPANPMWTSPSSVDLPRSLVWEPPAASANMVAAGG
jgi:hypothetical protein